jgi:hypothetical protein
MQLHECPRRDAPDFHCETKDGYHEHNTLNLEYCHIWWSCCGLPSLKFPWIARIKTIRRGVPLGRERPYMKQICSITKHLRAYFWTVFPLFPANTILKRWKEEKEEREREERNNIEREQTEEATKTGKEKGRKRKEKGTT